MKTEFANSKTVNRKWFVVDVKGQVLGRMASNIATILQGKHKPMYTPHVDTGDFVVVVNAADVKLTGNKRQQKVYQSYSGYPGGQRVIPFEAMFQRRPDHVFRLAVKRMLPVSRLGKQMLRKLHVYGGAEHPHGGQKPEALVFAKKK